MASVAKREWTYQGQKKTAWVVRYVEDGKHRSKQFEKMGDAKTYKQKVEREIVDGLHIPDSEALTIAQVAERFLRTQQQRHADKRLGRGRLKAIENALNTAILPYCGNVKCKDFAAKHVEELYERLRHPTDGGRPLSATTAKDRIKDLNYLMDFALQRSFIKTNVVPRGRKMLGVIHSEVIRTFTVEEVKAIVAAARQQAPRQSERVRAATELYVSLAAFCGLRLGEILGLHVENVRLDLGLLQIRHSKTPYQEIKGPKTAAGVRDIPMPDLIAGMFANWMKHHYIKNKLGLLFTSRTGHGVSHQGFRDRTWYPLLKRVGLHDEKSGRQPHFHALRHFAASWMIENGVSLPDTAALLGHKKFDMTLQVYAHPIIGGSRRQQLLEGMVSRFEQENGAEPLAIAQELRTAS